jgi:hypothetical protein
MSEAKQTVILCEGFHDRAFWKGWLSKSAFPRAERGTSLPPCVFSRPRPTWSVHIHAAEEARLVETEAARVRGVIVVDALDNPRREANQGRTSASTRSQVPFADGRNDRRDEDRHDNEEKHVGHDKS